MSLTRLLKNPITIIAMKIQDTSYVYARFQFIIIIIIIHEFHRDASLETKLQGCCCFLLVLCHKYTFLSP